MILPNLAHLKKKLSHTRRIMPLIITSPGISYKPSDCTITLWIIQHLDNTVPSTQFLKQNILNFIDLSTNLSFQILRMPPREGCITKPPLAPGAARWAAIEHDRLSTQWWTKRTSPRTHIVPTPSPCTSVPSSVTRPSTRYPLSRTHLRNCVLHKM